MADIIWDPRPYYVYYQTPKEAFAIIERQYEEFKTALNDAQSEPVRVFSFLKESQLEELELIREVSKVLQAKKDEDIRKSKAAAEEAKVEAEKAAEAGKEGEEGEKTAEDNNSEVKESETEKKEA